jgi:phenylacetate-CoA ligase
MKYFEKKLETMPRNEIKALQSERLCETVKRVYEKVAPYRAKMDALKLKPSDIKSVDDLHKLPFNDKTDLRDNYPFGLFAVPRKDLARIHASSGTTGKMTVVGYTANDLKIWGRLAARCLCAAGAGPDDIIHIAYGYGMFTGGLGLHVGAEALGAAVVPASVGNTMRQITFITDFKPDVLCCTPSYASYIADEMLKAGIKAKDISLKTGVFGAEPCTDGMRKSIESGLGLRAHDIYGLSEIMGPGVSCECECQNGLHIWEDNFIAEIIDPETLLPITENGKIGELVFTTVAKEGMPLIRYRTKDLCALNREVCACGRTHARMGKILGRSDDMLIIRGVNVFPSQIESVLMSIPEASQHYQIYVTRDGSMDAMEVRIELNEKMFSDTVRNIERLRKELERKIHDTLGLSAAVRLVEPRSIPRSEGKAVRVVDNRK